MNIRYYIITTILLFTAICASPAKGYNSGIPFITSHTPEEYGAHDRNFDILSDNYGRIYVANFEGLLYYDHTKWHIIHTPGVFRITRLFKDYDGRIWVGGYNVLGYLYAKPNGELSVKYIFSKNSKGFIGEVTNISRQRGKLRVETSIGAAAIQGKTISGITICKADSTIPRHYKGTPINQTIRTTSGKTVLATHGSGLIVLDSEGNELYSLNETNGLCDNNVNAICYDSSDNLWGATDKGVFAANIESPYTRFGKSEGINGSVQSILPTSSGVYVGTLRGLFYKNNDKTFSQTAGIGNACWDIKPCRDGGVYACTANGLYLVNGNGARQITGKHTLTMQQTPSGGCYTAELDGIYYNNGRQRTYVNYIEKGVKMFFDAEGALWVANIFGQVFRCTSEARKVNFIIPAINGKKEAYKNTLLQYNGHIYVLSGIGTFVWDNTKKALAPVSGKRWKDNNRYPLFAIPDSKGMIWQTANDGTDLHCYRPDGQAGNINSKLKPLRDYTIQTIGTFGDELWAGSDRELIHWHLTGNTGHQEKSGNVYIRRIELNGDSVVWGGFGGGRLPDAVIPSHKFEFAENTGNITIYASTDFYSPVGKIFYRYRTGKSQKWSAWTTDNIIRFSNPRPGNYTVEIEASDEYGNVLAAKPLSMYIHYPIYIRWYSILLYVVLISLAVYASLRIRMRRLIKEKQQLENIVEERTSQIRCQKEEIETKSQNLEVALEELKQAQFKLVRQERMATVGTLTKGLVDRILNPMNYVNNFSHMSIGLAKDLRENIEDEKDSMNEDTYDDSIDVIEMISTNLQKIEEHGVNTTRILKAMEALLKEREPDFSPTDLGGICRKDIEKLSNYYAKEIAQCKIQIETPGAEASLFAEIDAEQVSRTIMSILVNSLYALHKKYTQHPFDAKLRLEMSTNGDNAEVKIYDNGIGIEEAIIDNIFDPFFTTKTTAEAVGVGLYISREVILNHGGNISVKSEKDKYTEFIVALPIKQASRANTSNS